MTVAHSAKPIMTPCMFPRHAFDADADNQRRKFQQTHILYPLMHKCIHHTEDFPLSYNT